MLVLVTDGQVGNEDQILRDARRAAGRDPGVHSGHRPGGQRGVPAPAGGAGRRRCELVESEDRLDEVMRHPSPDRHAAVDRVVAGRGRPGDRAGRGRAGPAAGPVPRGAGLGAGPRAGHPPGRSRLTGTRHGARRSRPWSPWSPADDPAVPQPGPRAHVRDLEDRYACLPGLDPPNCPAWNGASSTLPPLRRPVPVHRLRGRRTRGWSPTAPRRAGWFNRSSYPGRHLACPRPAARVRVARGGGRVRGH